MKYMYILGKKRAMDQKFGIDGSSGALYSFCILI